MADEGGKPKEDPLCFLGFKTVDQYSQGKELEKHFKRRDLEEKFDFIVDSNDDILERIVNSTFRTLLENARFVNKLSSEKAAALDDASGLLTRTEILVVNQTPKPNTTFKRTSTRGKKKPVDASQDSSDSTIHAERSMPVLIAPARPIKKAVHRVRVTEEPQFKFKVPVDNSLTPFIPKLKDKPNSLKPLSVSRVAIDWGRVDGVLGGSYPEPVDKMGRRKLKKFRKNEREKTKGSAWFNMPFAEMTPERKNDLEALSLRGALDKKRFYKRNNLPALPKYFQVGRIIETPADFYHSRVPKRQRKQTLAEEMAAEAATP